MLSHANNSTRSVLPRLVYLCPKKRVGSGADGGCRRRRRIDAEALPLQIQALARQAEHGGRVLNAAVALLQRLSGLLNGIWRAGLRFTVWDTYRPYFSISRFANPLSGDTSFTRVSQRRRCVRFLNPPSADTSVTRVEVRSRRVRFFNPPSADTSVTPV